MADQKIENIGKQAALLSLIEIGLGSFLHSFKIPFSGQVLSLNQIAFMTRVSKIENSRDAGLQISVIASLLKSLSPAGKKLTPMLAILAQGLAFSFGPLLLGVNIFGLIVGSIFSSLWAFIQPILMIYLLFGQSSIEVAEHYYKELSKMFSFPVESLFYVVSFFILLKIIIAIFVSFFAFHISEEKFNLYQAKIIKKRKSRTTELKHPALMALKDLLSPLFIISFGMTALFFFVTKSDQSQMIWGLMRPLALGFILFFIIRIYPVENISVFLEKIGLHGLSKSFKRAVDIVRQFHE